LLEATNETNQNESNDNVGQLHHWLIYSYTLVNFHTWFGTN